MILFRRKIKPAREGFGNYLFYLSNKPVSSGEFLKYLRGIFETTQSSEIKSEIIKRVLSRIEIGPASVTLHYVLGEPQRLLPEEIKGIVEQGHKSVENAGEDRRASAQGLSFVSGHVCSNSLTCGAPART